MITITNLSKAYKDHQVLKNVSLEIAKGETLVLLGPSGSGKSTLLRCLIGLTRFDEGEISVDGITLSAAMPPRQQKGAVSEIRKRCGLVFQQYHLFPHLSVQDNITLAPRQVLAQSPELAATDAKELLALVGLTHKIGQRPHQLSGGEQQRVAIARALAMKPDYLFYDEPTSALDPQRAREIWLLMGRLAEQGQTQIIVTHQEQIQEALPCRVVRMSDGCMLPRSYSAPGTQGTCRRLP